MPFPSGNASVNRIIAYASGLSNCGLNVDVVTIRRSVDGCLEWVGMSGFKYCCLGTNGNVIVSLVVALFRLAEIIYKSDYKSIILVSNSLLLIYPLAIVSRIKHIKLLQEKSEFPFVLRNKSLIGRLYAKFYVNTTYKLFDGLIVISNPLVDYFKSKVNKKCRIFLLPMMVDIERFSNLNKIDVCSEKRIAYCGDIGGNKDGIINLITAYKLFSQSHTDWKLMIIGDTKMKEDAEKIKSFVLQNQIKGVSFYGRASRKEMPELLCSSMILALARPSGLQSLGGFPTKLGEYLATGNPVVVTKVGDIPVYLEDNVTAFLVEPDDIGAFALKLGYVADNYDVAKKVGECGRGLATTVFNSQIQSNRLYNFILSLI